MTQDEIVEITRQAGGFDATPKFLETFAKLVAQHERERLTDAAMKAAEKAVDVAMALEREACAKVCDDHCGWTPRMIGSTIRARAKE